MLPFTTSFFLSLTAFLFNSIITPKISQRGASTISTQQAAYGRTGNITNNLAQSQLFFYKQDAYFIAQGDAIK